MIPLAFDSTATTSFVLACVAVLALLVAPFQERLRQWLSRAWLSMAIEVESPDISIKPEGAASAAPSGPSGAPRPAR